MIRIALLRACVAIAVLGGTLPAPAEAAAKKAKKKPEVPAAAPVAPAAPTPVPVAPPPPVVAPAPAPAAATPAPAVQPVVPLRTEPEKRLKPTVADPVPADAPPLSVPPDRPRKASWQGFFLSLNVGHASAGGKDGPIIPEPNGATGLGLIRAAAPAEYAKAVTTNRGEGLAAALQIGYNIKGLVSIWADLSWHGSFGSKADTAGVGTTAGMLGLHPLRLWRSDLPVDVRLYGGYGFFEILYYYESVFQQEATGKAWTGTSMPFGLATEYRFDDDGVFSMGLDLRLVQGSYDKWIYNNDKDIASTVSPPETTFRFEPRLMFGWHF